MTKLLDLNKVPTSSLEPSSLKFTRIKNENTTEKLNDLVRITTESHGKNISNLCHLVEMLHDNLSKRLRHEGTANGKL